MVSTTTAANADAAGPAMMVDIPPKSTKDTRIEIIKISNIDQTPHECDRSVYSRPEPSINLPSKMNN